jgi:hypothetical protein
MPALLLERPLTLEKGSRQDTPGQLDGNDLLSEQVDAHGRLTLDDLITGVWEGLAVRDTVNCPVCAGPMTTGSGVEHEEPPTGACLNCGSRLL